MQRSRVLVIHGHHFLYNPSRANLDSWPTGLKIALYSMYCTYCFPKWTVEAVEQVRTCCSQALSKRSSFHVLYAKWVLSHFVHCPLLQCLTPRSIVYPVFSCSDLIVPNIADLQMLTLSSSLFRQSIYSNTSWCLQHTRQSFIFQDWLIWSALVQSSDFLLKTKVWNTRPIIKINLRRTEENNWESYIRVVVALTRVLVNIGDIRKFDLLHH